MGGYSRDFSTIQVTDYASLIWYANRAIMESLIYQNTSAITPLVEYLETLLAPYIDSKYRDVVKGIGDLVAGEGTTYGEIKNNQQALEWTKTTLTHRALMELAYRKGFLPAGRSSSSSDFKLKGEDDDGES